MREHTHLPPVVSFVREHVAQHLRAKWPRARPAVPAKLPDATIAAECFRKHLRAARGALGQRCASLLRRAVCAIELPRNLQMRCSKPDPLAADVVHVSKDRSNRADFANRFNCRRFGPPGDWPKMFDQHLVHAVVDEEDPRLRRAELNWRLRCSPSHRTQIILPI